MGSLGTSLDLYYSCYTHELQELKHDSPVVAFWHFHSSLATQKKYPGTERHGVIEYVPPEEDVVNGEDLKGYTSPSGLKYS